MDRAFTAALERERIQHAVALEQERLQNTTALKKCQDENKNLRLSNDQLKKDLEELKKSTSSLVKNPIIGTFKSVERNPPEKSCNKIFSVSFTTPYSMPPELLLGFYMIDVGNNGNPCVDSYARNIQKDQFDIHIDTKGSAKLHGLGCTWLEVEGNDLDFQFGRFCTQDDHSPFKPKTLNSRYITFQRAYPATPQVVVWLTAFDMDREKTWHVKTYTTNVTATGFTIHIDGWSDTILYSAAASWIAYPADRANISSGRFNIADIRYSGDFQLQNSSYVHFGRNVFSTPPRVLLAINLIDVIPEKNLRLKVSASSVSVAGMTWHLDSWSNTLLASAGASYIAMG